MRRTIAKYRRPLGAILGLALIASLVGGYILANQRLRLPAWVPVLGSDFVNYEVELQTAQSVTPGQGQTVQIAGIDVGDIISVRLVDGRAVVGFKLRRRYAPIHRDAQVLLRPKTGLNDMVIALDPGTPAAGDVPEGWRIPESRSLPNVNPDEVLAALDGDTRPYLRMLIAALGEGFGENGPQTAAALRRFEPLSRDVARLTTALAERRANIRRGIHNFRLVSEALGERDDDLAALVDRSGRVFASIARQDAALRASLRRLPAALRTTGTTLGRVEGFARELGPAARELAPAARALAPAQRAVRPFLRDTTPILRDKLRPFARDTLPVVRELRPAARDLAALTPDLASTLSVLNTLLNTLAYNPPGKEEGYLFWASWANTIGASLFATADAHGPLRRGIVLSSCATLSILNQIGKVNASLGTLSALLNPPQEACPSAAPGAPAARSASSTRGGR